MTTTLRRRLTRWTACAMAAAACLLGTALPGVFNCLCIRLLFERIDA